MQPMTELEGDRLRRYYRTFARVEAADTSPVYAEWAQGVAKDDAIIYLLLDLPQPKRQANLLFAAARHLGAETGSFARLRTWLLAHWDETSALMLERSTQTNEAGRCAVLLPELARLEGPLSLIEVGSSAGLCLYPDRYSYHYRATEAGESSDRGTVLSDPHSVRLISIDPTQGRSNVVIECELRNASAPERIPEVVWRAGIDLDPIDITEPDQRSWLRSLIWPEHDERRERLTGAAEIVADDPPRLVSGDLCERIESLIAEAPSDSQIVVFHSAVLAYVDAPRREEFAAVMRAHPETMWLSNEGAGVLPGTRVQLEACGVDADGRFVLSVDGVAKALTGPHGQSYEGLSGS
ncbi:DUF2332 domain-containing protein [Brevibacterium renqingii]|uniref:DUF2332 domain-containing protein n=1 Tax=Brevibacterium renqingii TaxID=2776916 RepID=UPI001ADF3F7A|nr:DUF2332 domain-containing protein [Brevibacterium renqingii]